MNKTAYILFVVIATLITSCDQELDLEPQQSISADMALNTADNIQATLVGAYLEARGRYVMGSQFNEYAELLASSGDMQFVGSHKEPKEMIDKNITVNNSYVEATWEDAYRTINIVNTVMTALDVLDEEERDRVKGECLFLRGWMHFEMVRLWGQQYQPGEENDQPGVPVITEATQAAENADPVARNTVDECYTQIREDLETAETLLPESNGVFATTYAASAILSRVYLQQSDFAKAAEKADRVIESGVFSLAEKPQAAFNNSQNTQEDIFAFQNTHSSNTIWLTQRYASLSGMGRGDYQMAEDFFTLFDDSDLRGQVQEETEDDYTYENIDSMYYIGVGSIRSGGINTYKYANYYSVIPSIRLAEMYLTRAEANFELEEAGQATVGANTPTEDINVIRERAQAPLFEETVTRQQIRDERYRELCWEGFRLHDLRRWQEPIDGLPWDAGKLLLPIPTREMENNDLLEQNPYYQ
ncbi:MAG: RagB/SusD family nutrient uptake outer membrane protein [Bacteroidales bacterium]|nr:RagB/SusD family nutrient uptake outer membrane protein [Bacteroidales bacterium]MCF8338179.1 RagB/SusD family nutrient uptake outer membrane protein [Bacteroidales bacterium]